jgi:Cu2+-exporting ATPase
VRETLGGGLSGVVNGHDVIVGRPEWVRGQVRRESPAVREAASLEARLTPVLVAVDGAIVARVGFGDPLRAEARDAVKELQRRGWRVRLLSGDAPEVVRSVAESLGIAATDAEGGASPERKREAVEAERAKRTVIMVGDGVNDAAAISAATVGIAVRGGAEASMAAADVYLARGGVGSLRELVEGALRTTNIIHRNMLIALGYNLIGVVLAMMGAIDPLFAAILMPLSSVTVVVGAWQGKTFPRSRA